MEHPFYEAYAGLLAAELLGLAALCDEHATFYVRRHAESTRPIQPAGLVRASTSRCGLGGPARAGWPSAAREADCSS